MGSVKSSGKSKWLIILCLILAGEIIFGLPFHVVRYFRPTFLEVFGLTNTQLGDAMAIYGVTAMISYFPGGVLADRFSARSLMSLSLVSTAIGGFFLLLIPGQLGLSIIFAYWGVTTILMFWSAMLRTTREWGGELAQGRAFGILDGGRGLVAAGLASLAVLILAIYIPQSSDQISDLQRIQGLKAVIVFYSLMAIITAIIIWLVVPGYKSSRPQIEIFKGIGSVLKTRSVWLQAIIVVCAYCGYRGLDFYGIYGVEFLGMDELSSAKFVSNAAYLRALGAIAAGFIADRVSTRKTILFLFGLLILIYMILALVEPINSNRGFILGNLIITFLAVYALRGVYFALFEEMKIKGTVTGTTIGMVSVIGYTPDIFFNSIAGRIIESVPGIGGYHNYYFFLGCFAILGLVVSLLLIIRIKKSRHHK